MKRSLHYIYMYLSREVGRPMSPMSTDVAAVAVLAIEMYVLVILAAGWLVAALFLRSPARAVLCRTHTH